MRSIALDAIREAAVSIYDLVVRTPLVRLDVSDLPSVPVGTDVFVKLETLQPVGSFKIRGAHNVVRQLAPPDLAGGVWTVSAGNAALGVALAARHAGAHASVLVSNTAPRAKLDAIHRLGATIVPASYDECWRAVETHASERMAGYFIHPFDNDQFIAGNATLGLEIVEDLPHVDAIVAAVGGGGLLAGIGAAVGARGRPVRIVAAEPESAAPLSVSLARGEASRFEGWTASFVDGAGGRSVLPSMWPLLAGVVTDSVVVPLDQVARAMRLLADRAHVIAEGAAACALAAALTGRVSGTVVVVVSGGNIDLSRFAELTIG